MRAEPVTSEADVERRRISRSWRELGIELALIGVAAFLPFAWRVWVGAGTLPAGDAWAYERIFDTFHNTGHLRLVGWNDITLVGMIPVTAAWVALTGYGPHQLHLLGSVMCVAILLGVRSLLVTFRAPNRLAPLAVIGGASGLVGIAGTYLSDSFAVAGAVWAVALTARALQVLEGGARRPPDLLVVGAALTAAYGFLVRQQMGVAAAVAIWLLWRAGPPARRALGVFAAVFVAVSLPVYLWRSGLPNGGTIAFDLHPRGIVSSVEGLVVTYGLLLFAGTIWVREWRHTTRRAAALIASISVSTYIFISCTWSVAEPFNPLLDGIQRQWGLDRGAVPMLATLAAASTGWVWAISTCVAAIRRREPNATHLLSAHPFAASILIVVAVEMAVVLSTGAYFTRYSLLTACLALVAITARGVDRTRVAVLVTLGLAVASYWELDHSLTPTDAVMTAGRITSCLGIPPENVDATFSWDGKHYQGIASVFRGDLTDDDGLPPTHDRSTFPAMQRDAVLTPYAPGRRASWTVIGPIPSDGLLPGNRQLWWLTIRSSAIDGGDPAACAAGASARTSSVVPQKLS